MAALIKIIKKEYVKLDPEAMQSMMEKVMRSVIKDVAENEAPWKRHHLSREGILKEWIEDRFKEQVFGVDTVVKDMCKRVVDEKLPKILKELDAKSLANAVLMKVSHEVLSRFQDQSKAIEHRRGY